MDLKKKILHKSRIYPVVLIILMMVVAKYRENRDNNENKTDLVHFTGQTMGTNYSVKYLDPSHRSYQHEIDSILVDFNQSLSTYIPNSEISTFNEIGSLNFQSTYFLPVLKRSREINELTKGAFNPTIMPLVNAWGFGPERGNNPDSAKVKQLLDLVDFSRISFTKSTIERNKDGVSLDFSAIAKGYGVDVLVDYLQSKNITNMMIEIGGEVYCAGKNEQKTSWLIGIEKPVEEERELHSAIKLENQAIATSGNYRNYYEVDGRKYAHTISPFTGYPQKQNLLSVSVIADDCMSADAFATAFMVLGLEKTKQVLAENPELKAYLIYSQDSSQNLGVYVTDNLKNNIIQPS